MPLLLLPTTGGTAGGLPTWPYRRQLTIDEKFIDSTLTDFPLLVKLTEQNFDFTHARSDGFDVRFFAADGVTALDFERARHDNTGKLAEYWVRVPSVSSSADTIIWIHYGNPAATDGATAVGTVWDANFLGVYHMDESPAATTPALADMSGTGRHGTMNGSMVLGDREETPQGRGWHFDGALEYVSLPSFGSLAAVTVECWYNPDSFTNANGGLVSRNNFAAGTVHFDLQTTGHMKIGPSGQPGVQTPVTAGQWVYGAYTFATSGNVRLFKDGTLAVSTTAGATNWDGTGIEIAHEFTSYTSGARYLDGIVDEVRISNVVRSDAWIKACYFNSALVLLNIGDEGGIPRITFVGSDSGGGNVTTFLTTPALNDLKWPAGVQANDVAILFQAMINTATATVPTGFSLIGSSPVDDATCRTYVMQKVCTGSETGDVGAAASILNRTSASIVVWRGLNVSAPVNAIASLGEASAGTVTHQPPAVTPSVVDTAIVTLMAERSTTGTDNWIVPVDPNSFTKRTESLTAATGSGGTSTAVADDGLVYGRPASVATTPGLWTSGNAFSGASAVMWTLALAPDPGIVSVAATGSLNAGIAGMGVGAKKAVSAGQGTTAVAALDTSKKVVTRDSVFPAVIAGFSTGQKVITRSSALRSAVTSLSSGKKVGVNLTRAAIATTAMGSGNRTANDTGSSQVVVTGFGVSKKVITRSSVLPGAITSVQAGKKLGVCASRLPAAIAAMGVEKKIANEAGRLNAAVASFALGKHIGTATSLLPAVFYTQGSGSAIPLIYGVGQLCVVSGPSGTSSRKSPAVGAGNAAITGVDISKKVVTRASITAAAIIALSTGKKVVTRQSALPGAITSLSSGRKVGVSATRLPAAIITSAAGLHVGKGQSAAAAAIAALSTGRKVGNSAGRGNSAIVFLSLAKHVVPAASRSVLAATALGSGKHVGKGLSAGLAIAVAQGFANTIRSAATRQVVVVYTLGEGTSEIITFGVGRLFTVITTTGAGTKSARSVGIQPAVVAPRSSTPTKKGTASGRLPALVYSAGVNRSIRGSVARSAIVVTSLHSAKKRIGANARLVILVSLDGRILKFGAAPNVLEGVATPLHLHGFVQSRTFLSVASDNHLTTSALQP